MTSVSTIVPDPARFCLRPVLIQLWTTVAVSGAITWVLLDLIYRQRYASAVTMAVFMSFNGLFATISAISVAFMVPHGTFATAFSYFGGTLLRLFGNVLAVAFLGLVAKLENGIIILALALSYLPLLVVETVLIGRFLWYMQDTPHLSKKASGA